MICALSQWVFMLIACPNCHAQYEVPASRLPPRRMVRCARCGNKWMAPQSLVAPTPPSATGPAKPAGAIDSLPAVTAMDRLAAQAATPIRPAGLLAAWILTAFVLVAGVAATMTWRQSIVRAWPASARILGPAEPPPARQAATGETADPSPAPPAAR
jgi:predicted Zn finger-like uncharacterized protein